MSVRSIGVLTSGGDAPGMNAAVRGIVRSALQAGIKEVIGIKNGYKGLFNGEFIALNHEMVGDMLNRGGTFLGSARFPEMRKPETGAVIAERLQSRAIDVLIVIGGNGSYSAANRLAIDHGINWIGIPGSIDNDVPATDYAIGYATALETIVDAIDRLRDTSSSHKRISIVEVMGRDCGALTLAAGLAGGCEYIAVPEEPFAESDILKRVQSAFSAGKRHAIVAITEKLCDVNALAAYLEEKTGHESRATILGHIQRGGAPCAFDRILASRMGAYAIEVIQKLTFNCCIGFINGALHDTPFSEATKQVVHFDASLLKLANQLC